MKLITLEELKEKQDQGDDFKLVLGQLGPDVLANEEDIVHTTRKWTHKHANGAHWTYGLYRTTGRRR